MIALAIILSICALVSWAVDFSPIGSALWISMPPPGCPKDLLFGAGLCTGFTIASSAAWAAMLVQMIFG